MFLFSYHSTHAKIDHKVREKFDLFANDRGFLFPKSLDLLEPLRGNNTSSDLSCAIGDYFHQVYWNNISLSPTDTLRTQKKAKIDNPRAICFGCLVCEQNSHEGAKPRPNLIELNPNSPSNILIQSFSTITPKLARHCVRLSSTTK